MYGNPKLCFQWLCFLCCDAHGKEMTRLSGNDVFGIPREFPVVYRVIIMTKSSSQAVLTLES